MHYTHKYSFSEKKKVVQIYLSFFFVPLMIKTTTAAPTTTPFTRVVWVEPDWAAVILSVTTFATLTPIPPPPLRFHHYNRHTRTAHYMYIIFRFYSFFFLALSSSHSFQLCDTAWRWWWCAWKALHLYFTFSLPLSPFNSLIQAWSGLPYPFNFFLYTRCYVE